MSSELRDLLNNNYYNIRPILVEALNNAIRVMEDNEEEDVYIHLRTLIIQLASNFHNDAESIDSYLFSVNQNSSTRQFFERFVVQQQAAG